ncbi:MAG: hypothetical protein IJ521_03495, partial [Schwartzia sp.]|nr:hypothetical protein [Schwartzia sp. (in: firmicutes)]
MKMNLTRRKIAKTAAVTACASLTACAVHATDFPASEKVFAAENLSVATRSASETYGVAPDYAQKTSWYQLPNITKGVDTLYIYAT